MSMRCDDRGRRILEIARDLEIFKLKMDGFHTDLCEIGMDGFYIESCEIDMDDLCDQVGRMSDEVGVMIEKLRRMQ